MISKNLQIKSLERNIVDLLCANKELRHRNNVLEVHSKQYEQIKESLNILNTEIEQLKEKISQLENENKKLKERLKINDG